MGFPHKYPIPWQPRAMRSLFLGQVVFSASRRRSHNLNSGKVLAVFWRQAERGLHRVAIGQLFLSSVFREQDGRDVNA
jgi:hypothetical protein